MICFIFLNFSSDNAIKESISLLMLVVVSTTKPYALLQRLFKSPPNNGGPNNSANPSSAPTSVPSSGPSGLPSVVPGGALTSQPSTLPSDEPSSKSSSLPSGMPFCNQHHPCLQPSVCSCCCHQHLEELLLERQQNHQPSVTMTASILLLLCRFYLLF